MSALSDALNEANEHGWSSRQLAKRAGDRVSHTQLAKYLKPDHPRPSEQVLQAFHEIFPTLSIQRLRELAGRPPGERTPYEPPPEADLLSARQRKAVDELIRSIVTANETRLDVSYERTVVDVLAAKRAAEELDVVLSLDEALEVLDGRADVVDIAARRGEPVLRNRRRQQDAAGEAPDPEGPEGGA